MASAPQVAVGITSAPELRFTLGAGYTGPDGTPASGPQTARIAQSGIAVEWQGRLYPSLTFTPADAAAESFELEAVTIGVNFHWQRDENQRFRGSLRLIADAGRLTAVNLIDVESYLVSVISSEMSATSSLPLLRAHAVISRSWLLSQMKHHAKPRRSAPACAPDEIIRWWDHEDHTLFDVCADDHCQRYQGINRVTTPAAAEAVGSTRGQVLMHGGELCDARFSKCCGGVFERFENCWEDTPLPYLVARRDSAAPMDFPDLTLETEAAEWIDGSPEAFCNTADRGILAEVLNGYDRENIDFYRWSEEITQSKLRSLIASRLDRDLGPILSLTAVERGTSGRIVRLRIDGTEGSVTIGKELMIRRTLSDTHLRSSAFTVEPLQPGPDGVPAAFRLRGAGWGHGAGLCQIGAAVMGARGYDYDQILSHYYPGSELTTLYS